MTEDPELPSQNTSGGVLTIVMPCLNEAETIAICVQSSLRALRENGIPGEVIVADNGSTDGSQAIAVENGARVVPVPIRGYGAALMAGIKAANTPYVLMIDADDSYNFSHAPRFLAELQKGAGLVMGNRFRGGIEPGAMPFLHKYLGNPVLSLIGRVFFPSPARDFHCGIRAFSKEAFERMDLHTTGMEFASEMVVKASLLGIPIAEVPTTLKPDGRSRAPHLRTWPDGWRHLRFLMMYSPRWLFLYPGLLLTFLGLVGTIWLLPHARTVGEIRFDVNTLVYATACLLLGYHTVFFAVSAKVFAVTTGLLPENPGFSRWFRLIKLETGLVVGGLTFIISLLAAVWAVAYWEHSGYGPLQVEQMLRITLPSATGMVFGLETCFASFFLSMMGLRRR
jgi:glycosyltransferase involved in cell wall biosynthesis